MSCHHHSSSASENALVQYLLDSNVLGIEGLSLTLALLVFGVIGSFTHCVGMCGPIALGQMNIRLMHLDNKQLTNWNKINCALSMPYYLGKAITYGLLALMVKFLSVSLGDNSILRIATAILLITGALICLQIATVKLFSIKLFSRIRSANKFLKFLEGYVVGAVKKLSLNPFGLQGFFMGMILGLIPCGLVMSSIMIVTSYKSSLLVAFLAMFFFGLGTFPALFALSFFGQNIMLKAKKYLNFIYSVFMFVNFTLLLKFAIKLLH